MHIKDCTLLEGFKVIELDKYNTRKNVSLAFFSGIYKEDEDTYYNFTDKSLFCGLMNDIIYINQEYFKNNYDAVINYIVNFIEKYQGSNLKILSTSLVNDRVLIAIANNKYINFLTIGSIDNPYTLTKEKYDILAKSDTLFEVNTDKVSGEFSNEDKRYISWFNKSILAGNYSYSSLQYADILDFDYPISDDEINNLKEYGKNGVTINLNYDNYSNIIKVIEALKGKNIKFLLRSVPDIYKYGDSLLGLINEGETIDIVDVVNAKHYILGEELLDLFVKNIKDSNLSPYERYIAVYNLVKRFKRYEDTNDVDAARDPYEILFNDYIICTGFSNLLVKLLKKVGIDTTMITVSVFKEREKITLRDEARLTKEEIEAKLSNQILHARVLVRLVDPKYEINGLYLADPTWDNSIRSDRYGYLLLTPFESSIDRNHKFNETEASILNVSSGEEFVNHFKKYKGTLKFLKDVFREIDRDFYDYLDNNYDIDSKNLPSDFYIDVYNYIVEFTKRPIDKEVFAKALKNVFKFIYVNVKDEDIDVMVDQVMVRNNLRNTIASRK